MDVNPLDQEVSRNRYWYCLLPVFIGIILLVQAASATLMIDTYGVTPSITLGDSVIIKGHVYDHDNPGVVLEHVPVQVVVVPDSGVSQNLNYNTDAFGKVTFVYTPQWTGNYTFNLYTSVNYSTIQGLPAVGVQQGHGFTNILRVTPRIVFHPVTTLGPIVLLSTTTTTSVPVTTTPTAQPTTPVIQGTQSTQVTQASLAPQPTSTVPASPTDTVPPVTTLTLAGTEDGSGGYSSDVVCTLSAVDNTGGSGVKETQYSFDRTTWYTYAKPVSVVRTGVTTLYYRSVDNAGNLEVAQVKAVVISGPGTVPAGTAAKPEYGTPSVATTSADAIPFFPLPLWLVALILFVIVAAVGGALYLESQQKKEEKK
jgi:hypothetical protein